MRTHELGGGLTVHGPPRAAGSAWRRRVLLTAGAVLLLAAATLMGVGERAAEAAPSEPRVNWQPCGDGFECATVAVPLSYDRPGGAIQVRLIRLPASGDPDERIGSLFTNPGGPGGSGVEFVRNAAAMLPVEIRERYDLVGFDPRGIARSTGLRCYGSERRAQEAVPPFFFPVTGDQISSLEELREGIAVNCDRRGGRIIDHISTANVARDLDVLREAVGDEKLHYIGFSYGSQLGNTYINLFPENVGRVVLDGIVDPVAWTVGREGQQGVPTFIRIGSAEGAAETLGEFHRLCDDAGPAACPLAPDSEARLLALLETLRALPEPIVGVDPITGEDAAFTYDFTMTLLQIALDEPALWTPISMLFASLEGALTPQAERSEELGALHAQFEVQAQDRRWLPNYPGRADLEGLPGVTCSDSSNHPATFGAWPAAVEDAVDTYGVVAEWWAWLDSQCPTWPGEDDNRYEGPDEAWSADTDETVLLVNARYDASTPHGAAQTVDGLLGNSQLVTYEGWGHVAYLRDLCTTQVVNDYLLQGAVPDEDPRCPAPPSPFVAPPPPAEGQ